MPSTNATEAAIAATMAEWLEGIPPVLQISNSSVSLGVLAFFLFNRWMIVFNNWAKNRLEITDKKTGFSINRIKAILNHGW